VKTIGNMLVTVSEEIRAMSISKNNILFEARSSPLPCRDSNDRQLREIWIGSSRSIFVYVDSNMMPGCESPAHFKDKPFSSSWPNDARMGHGNFHRSAPNSS